MQPFETPLDPEQSPECAAWEALLMDALDMRGDLSTPTLGLHPAECPGCRDLWQTYRRLAQATDTTGETSSATVSPALTNRIVVQLTDLATASTHPATVSATSAARGTTTIPAQSSPPRQTAPAGTPWWIVACCAAILWGVFWSPFRSSQNVDVPELVQAPPPSDLQPAAAQPVANLEVLVATAGSAYQKLQSETVAAAQEFALLLPPQVSVSGAAATTPDNAATPAFFPLPAVPNGLQPIQQSVREGLDFLWLTVPQDLKSAG